jgi:hypothetical protein
MCVQWRVNQKRLYAGSWFFHFKVCLWRASTLFKRDKAFVRTGIATAVIMAVVIGKRSGWCGRLRSASARGCVRAGARFHGGVSRLLSDAASCARRDCPQGRLRCRTPSRAPSVPAAARRPGVKTPPRPRVHACTHTLPERVRSSAPLTPH